MRVQGPVLAGEFLDVRFCDLRDVVLLGLITCGIQDYIRNQLTRPTEVQVASGKIDNP